MGGRVRLQPSWYDQNTLTKLEKWTMQ